MSGPGDSSAGKPEEHKRRSVYQVVRRNALSPFLAVFDAPRPFATTGRRDETNVPAQSLALLNDPLVVHCAAKWADRTLAAHSDTDSRLRTIFTEAFARPPRDAEIDAARRFLADREADPAAWRELAHSLIDAKEFIYLR